MSLSYQAISDQIIDLETQQRDIVVEGETPSNEDRDQIKKLEGSLDILRAQKDFAHKDEVEAAKKTATPIVGNKGEELDFRTMAKGDEYDIQFFRSAKHRKTPEKHIKEARAALQSDATPGSILVDEEWSAIVEKVRFERNFMRSVGAKVITTSTTHNIPVLTALGTAAIVGERTAYTTGDVTWENVVLNAYKLTHKTPVSEELLADAAYDVAGELAEAIGLTLAAGEEQLFLTGTGSSEPTGIFNKTADKTVAAAAAVTNDELIDIVYGLPRHYRREAIWAFNDLTVAEIAKAKLTVTTSGTLPYFWSDSERGEPSRLLGFPVETSSNIAQLGTGNKFVCFFNPLFYLIGERGPINVKRLQLDEHSDTFAWNQRIDGKPLDENAFYVAKNN